MLDGRGEAAQTFHVRLLGVPSNQISTTVISYEEQMRGWMAFAAKAKTVTQQVDAYRRLESHLEDFKSLRLLSFSESAAVRYQALRKAGIRVGSMDLRIAAIALANDAVLLTRNSSDFGKIPGLTSQDWSK